MGLSNSRGGDCLCCVTVDEKEQQISTEAHSISETILSDTVASSETVPLSSLESIGSTKVNLKMKSEEYYVDTITMDNMRAVFKPKGIAVVGATEREGSVGRTTLENLMYGYKSTNQPNPFEIYPVNPGRDKVLGLKCYPAVSAISTGKCESVVIITPASKCNDVVKDCTSNKNVKVVIIIAAGFKEIGEEGLKLENELVETAAKSGIAIIGPNCLGVMSPRYQLNATFAADSAPIGNVAFVSQSGAMCTAILDWALKIGQGFSAFVSIGSMSHIQWSHCIEYLGEDKDTNAIIMYMETVGNAENFMESARKVATKKPLIIIKAGKTAAAAAAAVSHTGSLAGSHDNFLAAMRRVGVLVVDTIDEIQNVAMITSLQPKPSNNKLYIITNAGGPGVLCTDAADISGLNVISLNDKLINDLSSFLPTAWSHANPLDVLGDAKGPAYAKTIEYVMNDVGSGSSILVILSPQSVTEPEPTAHAIVDIVKTKRSKTKFDGPIVCAWMGGKQVDSSRKYLLENGIPCFSQPDIAAQALGLIWKQAELAKNIVPPPSGTDPKAKLSAMEILKPIIENEKRSVLTESESKKILKLFGIDVAESIICQSPNDAVKAANEVRYPCVIKLNSETITHKSDVGGVKLNIKSDEDVIKAWNDIKTNVDKLGSNHFQGVSVQPMLDISSGVELLAGSTNDAQFGPMIVFGAGGVMVEIFRDASLSVPPLDQKEAKKLIDSTKISKALVPGHGERFKGCPMGDLEKMLMKFSVAICDLHEVVTECEINPILALPDRVVALDARIVLKTDNTQHTAKPCML